jgi:hypothetical protein
MFLCLEGAHAIDVERNDECVHFGLPPFPQNTETQNTKHKKENVSKESKKDLRRQGDVSPSILVEGRDGQI